MIEVDASNWALDWALRERSRRSGDRVFLDVLGEGTQTYAETELSARRLASGLARLEVQPGSTVVIMAANSFPAVHAWFAINLLGAVEVSINTAYRDQLLAHAINIAQAEVMVIESRFLPLLFEVEDRVPSLRFAVVIGEPVEVRFGRIETVRYNSLASERNEYSEITSRYCDLASIIYTSGTSGPAKGVMLTHAQNFLAARQSVEGLRLTERDRFYCVHPLFHMAGKLLSVYAQLLAGGCLILDKGFVADVWLDQVRKHKATVTCAHGPMLEMIFAQPPQPDDSDTILERVLACPMPKRIAAEFEKRFRIRSIEGYGMTEIGVPCWHPYEDTLRVGSCGRVLSRWYDFRIADPATDEPLPPGETGQILVRPKQPWTVMQGYKGMPEKTVEAWRNLWFHTGDAGYVDRDGYVYFVDRLDDRIRRRSESISSFDIEAVAMLHPAVAECAAIGVASEFESDDDIKLCVVVHVGTTLEPVDLLRHLSRRLPYFTIPRYIEFVDHLPRTPTNKIKKRELRNAGVNEKTWDRKMAGIALRALTGSDH